MPKPFSNNIVFVDTEFSSLDPYEGEILSIGLVKMNGEELYLELEHKGKVSEWVAENVTRYLTGQKISRSDAVRKIKEFIGDSKPYMFAYVNQFDTIYLYKLFGIDNHPFNWIPIDFASILFAEGMDPESHYHGKENDFYKKLGIDHAKYIKHHALDDAKLLREVYLRFFDKA